MRKELLYNPYMLLERIGQWAAETRRLRRLSRTSARILNRYHIDSLELLDLLAKNPPKVVYDIGANRGTWTLLAKTLFPECEIHAFEPLEILQEHAGGLPLQVAPGFPCGHGARNMPLPLGLPVELSTKAGVIQCLRLLW